MTALDPLKYLPHEKVVEICEGLDDRSLDNLIQTSKKAYDYCQYILNKRREKYESFVTEGFGPIYGFMKEGEFYIENFVDVLICEACLSRDVSMSVRHPTLPDEVRRFYMFCSECGKFTETPKRYIRPAIKCINYTKEELLLLANRIGYHPKSYSLDQFSKEELCGLLQSFFKRHGRMRLDPEELEIVPNMLLDPEELEIVPNAE